MSYIDANKFIAVGDATPPERAYKNSAGYDMYLNDYVTLNPRERVVVDSSIKAQIKNHEFGFVTPRSSLFKRGINLATGIIDSDYTGTIHYQIENATDEYVVLEKGERVAQFIFVQFDKIIGDNVTTEREDGAGLGSSGK